MAAKKTVRITKKSGGTKKLRKGRPRKVIKYTKTINVRFTPLQWKEVINWAHRANLEPSVYIRKILLDFLNVSSDER